MNEAIELVRDWRLLLSALLLFGVGPGVVLRLVVLVYPRDHPRREELVAELYAMRAIARPLWVAQQVETTFFEGIPARWEQRVPTPELESRLRAAATQVDCHASTILLEHADTWRLELDRRHRRKIKKCLRRGDLAGALWNCRLRKFR